MPAAAPGPPMFVVSDITKLRVYVNVPQNYVPAIKIGAKAVIIDAGISRTGPSRRRSKPPRKSVDVASGTTRMQLALDNAKGELMPGGYANVSMSLQRDAVPLHIPASALIFNQQRPAGRDRRPRRQGAVQDRDHRPRSRPEIELASGLAPDDRIIIAPPDGIADGDQVRVAGAKGEARDGVRKAGREGVGGGSPRPLRRGVDAQRSGEPRKHP